MNTSNVLALLERIIRIPLHQYARYFEKYSKLIINIAPMELVSEQEYKEIEEQVAKDFEEKDKTEQETFDEIKNRVLMKKAEIYTTNQGDVAKRWVYEAEIKRSYFHIKPLGILVLF
jgi:pre-mRNA-processing factor 39